MAGFANDVMYAKNGDFTQSDNQSPSASNGLATDGQLWIGSTALNVGGTHINVGALTSPDASVTIGYSSPNITLVTGGAVPTIFNGNSGSATSVANQLNVLGTGSVSVSGAGNTLTIRVNSGGFTWTDQAATFTAVASNGYFCTAALTVNLPAIPTQGDTIIINCDTASTVTIKASGTQVIELSSSISAAAGTAASTARGDSMQLVYRAADTKWCAIYSVGNWTIT